MVNRTLSIRDIEALVDITNWLVDEVFDVLDQWPICVMHRKTDTLLELFSSDLILSDEDFKKNRLVPFFKSVHQKLDKSDAIPAKVESTIVSPAISAADRIVAERGSTHGDYIEMSAVIQAIKAAMHGASMWGRMHSSQQESLDLTATKIGRIVTGDPMHLDHWDDIIGYNKLARDAMAKALKKG